VLCGKIGKVTSIFFFLQNAVKLNNTCLHFDNWAILGYSRG